MPRFFSPNLLADHSEFELSDGAARHVQVLRLQPGAEVTLFDGSGGEFSAEVLEMGRKLVRVRVGERLAIEREALQRVHLLISLIASERLDWAIEKVTELGAVRITPVLAERSSLRLSSERAEKKLAHWQAVAVAACEQCGRNRPPQIDAVQSFSGALAATATASHRWLLAISDVARPLSRAPAGQISSVLIGPEGGFTAHEQAAAVAHGWQPASLGLATLRAETAAIAATAALRG